MSAGISIILVVILLSIVLVTSGRIAEENKKHQLLMDVYESVSELDIVTYDYLLYHEKRMEHQWNIKHDSLGEILDGLAEEKGLISIRADYAALGNLFSQVTANYKERQEYIQGGASQDKIDAITGLEERLVAQLLIKSHSIFTDASTVAEEAQAEAMAAQRLAANLTLILMIILAITVTTSSLLVARSISKPLDELTKGAEIVGKGDLEHRVVVKTKDELGQLAAAFNKMTEQLFEDITERKRAEEGLKQTMAELERSNEELQQFAYVASHDLQEPLRMVASYTQLLSRRYKGKLDTDADEFITYAVDGATRMQQMINALLTYSRVDTRGKDFKPTDCKSVLEAVLANLRVAIEESGAVVTHDPLPTVMADEVQLTQLFQNLIDNAIKFRGDEPPRVHISAKQKGAEWVFSVRDGGIGIDPQFAERVFVIFQRLHGKQEYPGTGIGLAICQRIVERHGGRIWMESQPGEGSTFYFTIPIKEVNNSEQSNNE